MAARRTLKAKAAADTPARLKRWWHPRRLLWRGIVTGAAVTLALVLLFTAVNPPITHTIWSERNRLGAVERQWTDVDDIAPVMLRAVVAAEDANFCLHWGFDMDAIRAAIASGAARGGSTLSQQVTKNVFLWQERSYVRKALEAVITPIVEVVWSKRRILEVYLNVAETGEGIFGVEAAAQHYFGTSASKLTARQAALIAAALPNPKERNPARPTKSMTRRARQIESGAATIAADGRANCFQ